MAKPVFEEMFYTGDDPMKIISDKGLQQISDTSFIDEIIQRVIDENPEPVEQLKNGKEKALGFLIGRVMALTQGKVNPKLVSDIITAKIKKS
jgi:aspartyl-tRNA(Asn)/glutamyl-tRNA(Gln) amidotransferase subunit B